MPKGIKLWFFIKKSKNLIPSIAIIKELIKPTARKINWFRENVPAQFTRSKTVAASIVGTAKRKENSTMVFLFNPKTNPPMIVAAARETPGIKATD
jgi:hypothetical protein